MANESERTDKALHQRLINHDKEVIEPVRREKMARLERMQPAPVEAQVAFIKEMLKS
jgi:hypothetical protein